MTKKLESSKSTAKHIKQVSYEPQAATVIFLDTNAQNCHITSFKGNKESSSPDKLKSRNQQENQQYDRTNERKSQANRKFRQEQTIQKTDVQDVVIPHTCKVLDVLSADINVNTARKLDISVTCASRSHKNKHTRKGPINPKHTNYKLEDTLQWINIIIRKMPVRVKTHSASKCRSNQSNWPWKLWNTTAVYSSRVQVEVS